MKQIIAFTITLLSLTRSRNIEVTDETRDLDFGWKSLQLKEFQIDY